MICIEYILCTVYYACIKILRTFSLPTLFYIIVSKFNLNATNSFTWFIINIIDDLHTTLIVLTLFAVIYVFFFCNAFILIRLMSDLKLPLLNQSVSSWWPHFCTTHLFALFYTVILQATTKTLKFHYTFNCWRMFYLAIVCLTQ